jgi:hypothetical protein
MQLRWKRGFLRSWALLALAWVIFFGWQQYSVETRWTDPGIHVGGECWVRLAKWPDGTRLDDWDIYFDDAPAGSNNERDQWRETIRQKLKVCTRAEPFAQRWTAWANDNYVALEGSLVLIFLPPLSLLLFGCCISWIVGGFKPEPM